MVWLPFSAIASTSKSYSVPGSMQLRRYRERRAGVGGQCDVEIQVILLDDHLVGLDVYRVVIDRWSSPRSNR